MTYAKPTDATCGHCKGTGFRKPDVEGDPIVGLLAAGTPCDVCHGSGECPHEWRWSRFYTFRICERCGARHKPGEARQ